MSAENNRDNGHLGSVTSGLLLATSAIWIVNGNFPLAGAFAAAATVGALSEGKSLKPVTLVVSTLAGVAASLTLAFAMNAHNGPRGASETQDTPREKPAATQLRQARAPALPTVLTAKA
ncbi:MAG: hypothetical protein IT560_15375 [Alphaproteobacteria bacterium]|nr:hypothetical protein [Alphaproteobacteria bacterium]